MKIKHLLIMSVLAGGLVSLPGFAATDEDTGPGFEPGPRMQERLENMTPEQRARFEEHRKAMQERYNSMTPEEKEQFKQRREAMREKFKNMTPEQKEQLKQRREEMRKKWESMSDEEKQALRAKREERRKKWESMSEEERRQMREKMRNATPEERQKMMEQGPGGVRGFEAFPRRPAVRT